MTRVPYLARSIHDLSLHLCLCLDEEAYVCETRRLKVKDAPSFRPKTGSNAHVVLLETPTGKNLALVCLPTPPSDISREQIYALLVHEAVHVWRHHCSLIGEESPSEEFECYGIQAISQRLMCAYADAMAAKAKPQRQVKAAKKPKSKRRGR